MKYTGLFPHISGPRRERLSRWTLCHLLITPIWYSKSFLRFLVAEKHPDIGSLCRAKGGQSGRKVSNRAHCFSPQDFLHENLALAAGQTACQEKPSDPSSACLVCGVARETPARPCGSAPQVNTELLVRAGFKITRSILCTGRWLASKPESSSPSPFPRCEMLSLSLEWEQPF